MKPILTIILLLACIAAAHAQQQADRAQLRAGVWERILARLEALPDRWDALPAPAVPPSGRAPDEVIEAATEAEKQAARDLISDLALSPPEARAQIISQARQQRALSEVDLWFPLLLAQSEQLSDIDEAGLTIDGWLELAERLGRRDVCLVSSGLQSIWRSSVSPRHALRRQPSGGVTSHPVPMAPGALHWSTWDTGEFFSSPAVTMRRSTLTVTPDNSIVR
jgi:hypothetical protein